MVKKFIYFVLFALVGFLPFKVNALENLDSYYIIDLDSIDLSQQFYEDYTYKELLDYYSFLDSPYFEISTYIHDTQVYFTFISKNREYTSLTYTISGTGTTLYQFNTNRYIGSSVILNRNTSYTFYNSSLFNKINNCLINGVCWENESISGNSFNYGLLGTQTIGNGTSSINNNDDYTITHVSNYLYYSTLDIIYNFSYNGSSSYYNKSLQVNDVTLSSGDTVPSYYDLYYANQPNDSLTSYNGLPIYSIGGINKNDITSFNLQLKGKYFDYSYIDSLAPITYFFGRINHGDYYSYERINCEYITSYDTKTIDEENLSFTYTLFPNGFNCISNLTNYDNIYIYLSWIYNNTTSKYISNLESKVSKGYLSSGNLTDGYGLHIYERFYNLTYDTNIAISSYTLASPVYFESSNPNTKLLGINEVTQDLDDYYSNYNSHYLDVGESGLVGIIKNYQDTSTNNYNVDLFFNEDAIVSLSNNNEYTYYGADYELHTGFINSNVIINTNDNYNTTYYNNVVSSYINSLSADIYLFSTLIQNFYDSLPSAFQIFIYTIFIMFCFYFTYLLIKR